MDETTLTQAAEQFELFEPDFENTQPSYFQLALDLEVSDE